MPLRHKVGVAALPCAALASLTLTGHAAVPAAAATGGASGAASPPKAAETCGGHIKVYFGHTYKGTDSWEWKGKKPAPRVVKDRLDAPLNVTARFYADKQGYQWVDVTFTPARPSKIKPKHYDRTAYTIKTTGNPVKLMMKPEYTPAIVQGGTLLSPDDAGWAKAVQSQVSGYTFIFHKNYVLDALDCPSGSQVPKRLLQSKSQTVVGQQVGESEETEKYEELGQLVNNVDLKLQS
ncbi:hypothetical protein DZF91_06415 [Actinomadura logoneensis]|uniref:Uncharacterized protein n=1 Tax=Actinomadura logoneensis TaxID=2293572 RepID=A0A372JR21_9ACTN|nr:hypothetical protein [Actinomadura logoneensis]RFU42473.1 hypothetical protein DZF91_06415 [Actinomadura logoneensis]